MINRTRSPFGDELPWDQRVTEAVGRVRVCETAVDHGHAPVQNEREVAAEMAGRVEREVI